MNRLNAGIAFSHCWIAARHLGRSAELAILAAGQADAPEGFDDVASMKFAGRAASWSAATAV